MKKNLTQYSIIVITKSIVVTLCLVSCSTPLRELRKQYSSSAILNDSLWFSTVKAVKSKNIIEKPCAENKVTLMFDTDLPYVENVSKLKSDTLNGCTAECITTQRLIIYNLPLFVGKYQLNILNNCGTYRTPSNQNYWLLINGSGLFRTFHYLQNKKNWLRITRLDMNKHILEGKFEANLTDSSGHVIRFRSGRFKTKLPK